MVTEVQILLQNQAVRRPIRKVIRSPMRRVLEDSVVQIPVLGHAIVLVAVEYCPSWSEGIKINDKEVKAGAVHHQARRRPAL